MKDIIEVKAEDPETAKKRIEKISLTWPQSNFFLDTIKQSGNVRDYAICRTFIDSGMRLKELVLLNKDDIQVPIDEKGFYILPSWHPSLPPPTCLLTKTCSLWAA